MDVINSICAPVPCLFKGYVIDFKTGQCRFVQKIFNDVVECELAMKGECAVSLHPYPIELQVLITDYADLWTSISNINDFVKLVMMSRVYTLLLNNSFYSFDTQLMQFHSLTPLIMLVGEKIELYIYGFHNFNSSVDMNLLHVYITSNRQIRINAWKVTDWPLCNTIFCFDGEEKGRHKDTDMKIRNIRGIQCFSETSELTQHKSIHDEYTYKDMVTRKYMYHPYIHNYKTNMSSYKK